MALLDCLSEAVIAAAGGRGERRARRRMVEFGSHARAKAANR